MTRPKAGAALVVSTVLAGACAHAPGPPPLPTGAVTGSVRFIDRPAREAAIAPMVVMLEPLDRAATSMRPAELHEVVSRTDRFAPDFVAIARGDFLVFVNGGSVSHRLFSAQLGPELQIGVGAAASSTPHRVDHGGEVRFYCALHPDENFDILVTDAVFSDVVAADGSYYLGPVPDGAYRLSIWSPSVEGTIRDVQVRDGRAQVETIWIDPDLVNR